MENRDAPLVGRVDDVTWWVADPGETMERASLALDVGEHRLAIDPVDCTGLDELLEADGGIDGVAVLMDRHSRDARTIAARHDVPVYVPEGASRTASKVGGPVAPLEGVIDANTAEIRWVTHSRLQEEVAIWRPSDGTLVVTETLGTSAYFTVGDERVGVHPMMRLRPPTSAFEGVDPRRLFVGHGHPVADLEPGEVAASLAAARRRLPRAYLGAVRAWLPFG